MSTDELELQDEVNKFPKPIEMFTHLVGTPTPILSLNPLIKQNICKFWAAKVGKSETIKAAKAKVFKKLDVHLPESRAVQIHQLLDPGVVTGTW